MPESATIEAPPAAQATTPAPAAAPPAAKPGMMRPSPAREAMHAKLEKLANKGSEEAIAPTRPTTADPKPKTEPSTSDPKPKTEPGTADAPKPGEQPKPAEGEEAPASVAPKTGEDLKLKNGESIKDDKGRVKPFKLAEYYKEKYHEEKAENARLSTAGLAATEKQDYLTRIEQAEKRIKEYDDEMRFTNYSKSQEFKDKYQKPYDAAWKTAMSEIGELTLPTPDGGQRAVTPQDLLDLVNLPLGKARQIANELYGDFADDVMTHRKEIKRLADEQNTALEEAKLNGGKREKERAETQTKAQMDRTKHIQETFTAARKAGEADPQNGRFFTPKDGDAEWNKLLEDGKKFTARVYENPEDPNLTPDQRASIVKAHAAVFNRSAAYGPMKRLIGKLESELAEVKKENEGFKASRPGAGEGTAAPAANGTGQHTSAREGMMARLNRLASQG